MAVVARQLSVKLHDGGECVGNAYVCGMEVTLYQCGSCGVMHGLTANFIKARQDDHKSFYCPWCQQALHYSGDSEEEKLRKQVEQQRERAQRAEERAQATRDLLRHEQRSHAATRGAVTRKKKEIAAIKERIAGGVCPCCNRHFVDVERHMTRKHPDFRIED